MSLLQAFPKTHHYTSNSDGCKQEAHPWVMADHRTCAFVHLSTGAAMAAGTLYRTIAVTKVFNFFCSKISLIIGISSTVPTVARQNVKTLKGFCQPKFSSGLSNALVRHTWPTCFVKLQIVILEVFQGIRLIVRQFFLTSLEICLCLHLLLVGW